MFKRIGNLFSGFINLKIQKVEENNPEILLAKIEVDIDKKLEKATEDMVNLKVSYKTSEAQFEKAKKQMENLQVSIKDAIGAKDKELLTQLYIKEKEYQKTLDIYQSLYNNLKTTYEKAYNEYKQFKLEIQSKKISIEGYKAQVQANKMKKEMLDAIKLEFGKFGSLNIDKIDTVILKQTLNVETRQEFQEEESIESKIKRTNLSKEIEEAMKKAEEAIK